MKWHPDLAQRITLLHMMALGFCFTVSGVASGTFILLVILVLSCTHFARTVIYIFILLMATKQCSHLTQFYTYILLSYILPCRGLLI